MKSQTISTKEVQSGEEIFLRRALQSDALFSFLSSLVFIFAAGPVARFLGPNIPAWLVLMIGVGFLPFVYAIYWITADVASRWGNGRIIVTLNFIWVVASYLVLFLLWSQFTKAGRWFVALQAEVIFLLGVSQIIGLRRLTR